MTKKTIVTAVGYARRSTDLQERSIPDQKAYLQRWAEENGYRIARWYVDDAISGTSAKGRGQFERMIATAENGRDFEAILCYDVSRFSRGGRTVCPQTNIPLEPLDAFVVDRVRAVLLGDYETVEEAVEGFVAQTLAGRDTQDDDGVERELDAVNRRIKATVAMLADPAFDGLDELKTTLADLKARRDGLQARLAAAPASNVPFKESDLRRWATERFTRLDNIALGRYADVEARSLIHSCVDRIDIFPFEKRGSLYLPPDAHTCFTREISRRLPHGDPKGGVKSKGEA